jgi:hypothetical protein
VEVLERDSKAVLCAHRYQIIEESNGAILDDGWDAIFNGRPQLEITYQNFLTPWIVKTLTTVFRHSAVEGFFQKHNEVDLTLWAHLLSQGGHGIVLNRVMGVYRRHAGGIWSPLEDRKRKEMKARQAMMLVLNEGFTSRCIEQEFFTYSNELSRDLIQDASKALSALELQMIEVSRIVAGKPNLPSQAHVFNLMLPILCEVQKRLLSVHEALYDFICDCPSSGRSRLRLSVRYSIWIAAMLPLLILNRFQRFLRS